MFIGIAKGSARLRAKLAEKLADSRIAAHPEQIILTSGASHALDLVVRYLVQRGDTVLVDEPGYHNLFLNLHLQGARLLGVPRTRDGIDLLLLEELIQKHRPKIENSTALAMKAKDEKILLAPGQLLMPAARVVPWIRFNVAHSMDDRIYRFLENAHALNGTAIS